MEEDDPKLVKASRYRILCEKMEKLCARSCELKAAFEFVNTTMDDMCAEVDKMFLEEGDSIDEGIEQLDVLYPESLQVNGLKKRIKLRRVGCRLRKKVISKPTHHGQVLILLNCLIFYFFPITDNINSIISNSFLLIFVYEI